METGTNKQIAKDSGTKRQLPKNIRQIGNTQGSVKIYMEDYVYTYLHGSGRSNWSNKGSILLGIRFQENGQKYIFISGLVTMSDEIFHDGIPEFSDNVWGSIYQEMKQYYDNIEILGWSMDVSGACAKLIGELEKIHHTAFEGQDKLIFLLDSVENEEAFYMLEKNMLRRKDGYYVYYEKNPQMQEYMLKDQEKEPIIEADPQQAIVSSCRTMTAEKSKSRANGFHAFVYAASLALLITVSAMGVNMMTSSRKVEALEAAVTFLETDKTKIESDTKPIAGITGAIAENTVNLTEQIHQNTEQSDVENSDSKSSDTESLNVEMKADEQNLKEQDQEIQQTDLKEAVEEPIQENTSEEIVSKEIMSEENKSEQTPDTEQTETAPASAEYEQDYCQGYYIVEKGDSLLSISQKIYGRNRTEELCEKNSLEDENKIYAGQKLLLLE